jgi:hypothetical protein
MSDLVFHALLLGKPVASAHANKIVRNHKTGKAFMAKNPEWEHWYDQAIQQVEDQLVAGGHEVAREQVVIKSGPNKGKPGKNAHGRTTNVTNPLFDGLYRIIVWYFRPSEIYVRNEDGSIKMTAGTKRTPARKITRTYKGLDAQNVFKGAEDALQEGGAIRNDETTRLPIVLERPILSVDAEPFLFVEVKYFDEHNPQDYVIPNPCPIQDLRPELYMPRVYPRSHSWHELRRQEEAFELYLQAQGISRKLPVTKAKCHRCTVNVGSGWPDEELWWDVDEERWGKKVVLICPSCGERVFYNKETVLVAIKEETAKQLTALGYSLDRVASPGTPDAQMYESLKRRVTELLLKQFRTQYCLVTAEEIATVSWVEIARRQSAKQIEVFGETSDRTTRRNASARNRRPSSARSVVASRYALESFEGGEEGDEEGAELFDQALDLLRCREQGGRDRLSSSAD